MNYEPAPEDIIPRPRRRPGKATVTALLKAKDTSVRHIDTQLLTDVDGTPVGVGTITTEATLTVSLPLLGWTQAEYDNPDITE